MELHHEPLCFPSVLSGLYLLYLPVVRYHPALPYLPYCPVPREALSVLSLRERPVGLDCPLLLWLPYRRYLPWPPGFLLALSLPSLPYLPYRPAVLSGLYLLAGLAALLLRWLLYHPAARWLLYHPADLAARCPRYLLSHLEGPWPL